jgi:hypothetical protein
MHVHAAFETQLAGDMLQTDKAFHNNLRSHHGVTADVGRSDLSNCGPAGTTLPDAIAPARVKSYLIYGAVWQSGHLLPKMIKTRKHGVHKVLLCE